MGNVKELIFVFDSLDDKNRYMKELQKGEKDGIHLI